MIRNSISELILDDMNILILNWRDKVNPQSGGAEILTHEMAKRWVKHGHVVTQFSERFQGGSVDEVIDGIHVIRSGSATLRAPHIPVHLAAFLWYQKQERDKYDVVVDEIHGIPFFSPLYSRAKIVALICEVAHELWDTTFPFPWNKIGRFVEQEYFRFYRSVPFLTISNSTRNDLIPMGVEDKRITVLPMGLTVPRKYRKIPKEKIPTLLFIARLTKAKGVEDAIETLRLVRKKADVQLWIAGSGSDGYVEEVKEKIKAYGLADSVGWWGYVDEQLKFKLMQQAHLLIVPSVKEGWGLTVPEAGWFGTPAVGYDVGGLRDVIQHGKTGLLTKPNARDLSNQIVRLLGNQKQYARFCRQAQALAKTYSWDKTADYALSVLSSL